MFNYYMFELIQFFAYAFFKKKIEENKMVVMQRFLSFYIVLVYTDIKTFKLRKFVVY